MIITQKNKEVKKIDENIEKNVKNTNKQPYKTKISEFTPEEFKYYKIHKEYSKQRKILE